MRIAHIVSTFPPYKGGIGNVCYYQVVELAKRGYEITVFTPNYNQQEILLESDLPFKVIRLTPLFKYGNAAFIPQLLFKLKDFDIVHIHYPFLGIEFLYLLKLFKKKVKFVLQYQMDLVGKSWLKIFFIIHRILILPVAIKFSDRILVSSWDYFENSVIYKYYKKYSQKFIELLNGVDLKKFYPQIEDQKLLKQYNLGNKKILFFVGGLDKAHYFKGLEVLMNALKLVDNTRLLVAGDGNLKDYYISLTDKLGIKNKVIFVGKVSDEELVKYYNLCNIFVLPSIDRTEAFGLVLLEAMACGKIVVASNLPGVRSVVKNNIDGLLVKPNDHLDLANKINYLLTKENLSIEFSKAGRKRVIKYYDWVMITTKLENVYKSFYEII